MGKRFNATGVCRPQFHYMVNITNRLEEIKELIDGGEYFAINRARQFGKTTTLQALAQYLSPYYIVVNMDFQMLSHSDFESEAAFVSAFARELLAAVQGEESMSGNIRESLSAVASGGKEDGRLAELFGILSLWCSKADKPIVLMIDEVDSATNNQVFLDFLAFLRGYFNQRILRPTFQSVILAGVYDIKKLKQKIRPDTEHKTNSPWNIAADFNVDMSFSAPDIAGMLSEYEKDHETGMNIGSISELIYEYTSGYPFLVSRLCKLMDEKIAGREGFPTRKDAWTRAGFLEAVKILLSEKNTLFDSLINKLEDYPKLRGVLYSLLFTGRSIAYNPDDEAISMAVMFGFLKESGGNAVVSNRIFETRLYNLFLTASELQCSDMYKASLQDKNQFIQHGRLNMEMVLEKFIVHFNDLYGDKSETFLEEDGRRYFLLYLRPIINGTGNYYVESRTRSMRRTDVIVDYHGDQFVVEMKVWRGNEYNLRGEEQLVDYLDSYHLQKGYMLSFNFNKNKLTGMKRIVLHDKLLIEAVV